MDALAGLPLSRITLRLTEENLLTGRREVLHVRLTGVARRLPTALSAPTQHCGLLELRADKVRVYDYLGLFALGLSAPPPARMLCRPIPAQCRPVEVPDGQGLRPSSKSAAKRGPGEDYELREYRPGDPMRSVHWKLSSKWDELIVRERSDAVTPLPLLTVDYFGTPEKLDRLLDRLTGMSRALLNVQRPHAVLWLDRAGSLSSRWCPMKRNTRTACWPCWPIPSRPKALPWTMFRSCSTVRMGRCSASTSPRKEGTAMADKEHRAPVMGTVGDGLLLLCALWGLTACFLSLYSGPEVWGVQISALNRCAVQHGEQLQLWAVLFALLGLCVWSMPRFRGAAAGTLWALWAGAVLLRWTQAVQGAGITVREISILFSNRVYWGREFLYDPGLTGTEEIDAVRVFLLLAIPGLALLLSWAVVRARRWWLVLTFTLPPCFPGCWRIFTRTGPR